MRAQIAKGIVQIGALAAVLLFSSGCASYYLVYDKDKKQFSTGPYKDSAQLSCNGDIRVERDHGLFWWPGGFYRDQDHYHIYFKKEAESSSDFYFTLQSYHEWPRIMEAKGTVLIDGREVLIDIEYEDESGNWTKPPINGRHKIDRIIPDPTVSPDASRLK